MQLCSNLADRIASTVMAVEQDVREHYACWMLMIYNGFPSLKDTVFKAIAKIKETIESQELSLIKQCKGVLSKLEAVTCYIQFHNNI